jgi:type IV pilus assembly protein PilE
VMPGFGKGVVMMRESRGVTLIELLVVVVIIGILTMIMYPSYQQYTKRAHRAEAKTILLEDAQYLERKFTEGNTYDVAIPFDQSPKDGTKDYTIAVAADATTFTLTATPQGMMADDSCGSLTLNHLGQKNSDGDVASCWNK